MAIDMNILKKKGSWLAYKGETLAQGKEAAADKLTQHPDLMEEVRRDVLAKVAELNGIVIQSGPDEEEEPIFSGGAMPDSAASALDEDAIELDMDAPFGEDA
jgi:recombination protein RecA